MGSGSWTTCSYANYSLNVGRNYCASTGTFDDTYTNSSQAFIAHHIDDAMKPLNVLRECVKR